MKFNFNGIIVLVDIDGTTLDSEKLAMPHAVNSVIDFTQSIGHAQNVTQEDRDRLAIEWLGMGISQMVRIAMKTFGFDISDEKVFEICEDNATRVAIVLEKAQAVEGIAKAYQEIVDCGGVLTAVTSSQLFRVVPGLKNNDLYKYFLNPDGSDRVFSARDFLLSHPEYLREIPKSPRHPEIYVESVNALNAQRGKVVTIEDSKTGMGSALAAGIPVVLLTKTWPFEDKDAYATKILNELEEEFGREILDSEVMIVPEAKDIPYAIANLLDLPPLQHDFQPVGLL